MSTSPAKSAVGDDVIELLLDQHAQIRDLFALVADSTADERRDRR